jgi:hypothetical protein
MIVFSDILKHKALRHEGILACRFPFQVHKE